MSTAAWLLLSTTLSAAAYAQAPRKLATLPTTSPVMRIAMCGQTGLVAALERNGSIDLWRLPAGDAAGKLPPEDGRFSIACAPDGKSLAIGRRDGSVVIADVAGTALRTLSVAPRRIEDLAFSPDGTRLAVNVHESPAQLWDVANGSRVATLETDFSGSHDMDWSPDSSLLATADGDTGVRIYTRDGKLTAKYSGLLLEPFAIRFFAQGKQLVVGGADCRLTILNPADGRAVRQLPKQANPIFDAALLADQASLITFHGDASGHHGGSLRIWNLHDDSSRPITLDIGKLRGMGTTSNHLTLAFTADSDTSLSVWALAI